MNSVLVLMILWNVCQSSSRLKRVFNMNFNLPVYCNWRYQPKLICICPSPSPSVMLHNRVEKRDRKHCQFISDSWNWMIQRSSVYCPPVILCVTGSDKIRINLLGPSRDTTVNNVLVYLGVCTGVSFLVTKDSDLSQSYPMPVIKIYL